VREYQSFSFKGANFRICTTGLQAAQRQIRRQRRLLEAYIVRQPEFLHSMVPLELLADAPEVARRMAAAAAAVGVGPMAAVAGAMAQLAAEAALADGAEEAIVDNGGDLYLASPQPVLVALYAGDHPLSGRLAFSIEPRRLPLSVCSSSGLMGHSQSLGECDLATVVAADAALADAAATLAANLVCRPEDVQGALERVAGIAGIQGVLIFKGGRVGVAGDLPELVRHEDAQLGGKITHDLASGFRYPG
jgi:ApbE superfamily uncharacterized protein (UPF0280 family)